MANKFKIENINWRSETADKETVNFQTADWKGVVDGVDIHFVVTFLILQE